MNARGFAALITRRLLIAVVLLGVLSFGVFSLLYIAPGSAVQALIGPHPSTPALVKELTARYHLDEPFLAQYWFYLRDVLGGDFGTSIQTGQPVSELIANAIPVTFFLGLYSFLLILVSALTLGMVAALRQRSLLDRGIVGYAVFGVSAPAFATGFLLLYLFSVLLPWFPTFGAGEGFTDRLWHLTLPAIALALSGGGLLIKLTRAGMIGALDQDYVTFAKARGLSRGRVLLGYALRNAMIPILSGGGMVLAYVLTGAVLVEVTFNLPGLGSLLIGAVETKDIPVVQAVALLFAAVIILINLVTDLSYMTVDPRIRIGGRTA